MPRKPPAKRKPKLTDKERHARFVETARKIGASEDAKDAERGFKKIVRINSPYSPKS